MHLTKKIKTTAYIIRIKLSIHAYYTFLERRRKGIRTLDLVKNGENVICLSCKTCDNNDDYTPPPSSHFLSTSSS